MLIVLFIILLVAAYLLGSIPFGMVYAKLRGVDIRKVGSGNIGATNVSRQFGFVGGFLPVFILDFLKGALPVLLVRLFNIDIINQDISMIIIGMSALLGHIFPVYLGFKGGKGVATAAGVFLVIVPIEVFMCLAVFISVLFLARFIDLIVTKKEKLSLKNLFKGLSNRLWIASITAAIAFPVFSFIFEIERKPILVISVILTLLIIISHHKNIRQTFSSAK